MLYGIQGILSPQAFGASVAEKKRLVCFVLKYTGGATDKEGLGAWNFDNVLSPLKPYQNDIARQLGLSAEFNSPLNTHAAPQVSALTGAQTGRVRLPGAEAFTPTGNLINYSLGDGKSIDVLIGEKIATVLCGGILAKGETVSEQHFLDLERQMFVELCKMEKTQQRIEHMLQNGKALKN